MYTILLMLLMILANNVAVGQMPTKPPVLILSDDLAYIKCDVCQRAVKTLYKTVNKQRKEGKKLDEDDILSIVEKSCDTDNEYGKWITRLDITQHEDSLKLTEHPREGRCDRECKTIVRSCQDSIGDVDTDLGELLWRDDLKLSTFMNKVCHQLTSSCSSTKKKLKKNARKDYKFVELSEKEKEAMKVMNSMKGIPGMPGMDMYSPEDLAQMTGETKDGELPPPKFEEDSRENYAETMGLFDIVMSFLKDLWQNLTSLLGVFYQSEKIEL